MRDETLLSGSRSKADDLSGSDRKAHCLLKDGGLYNARGTAAPWYRGWDISDDERATFRATTLAAQQAKRSAVAGQGGIPLHGIYNPRLNTIRLMPRLRANGLRTLSLFSGGGGLDIGFDRAGFTHAASFELMAAAAAVLRAAKPSWDVYDGLSGDVTRVDWKFYRGAVDVLHGGPPCQPFSHAGRRQGASDARDMIPELVRAVKAIRPRVFVCENVSGLLTRRFAEYVQANIYRPLEGDYAISSFILNAADFGIPQRRKRVFFVGFTDAADANRFKPPAPTHNAGEHLDGSLKRTMGAREALGLPDIGYDDLAPTLRSGLTGPRHTTSVLNSVTALKVWSALQIWPNGVARTREMASAYVAKGGHFRLSLPDCMLLQGFPACWPIGSPVYMGLGLIGNSVAPPMGYHLAKAIRNALN